MKIYSKNIQNSFLSYIKTNNNNQKGKYLEKMLQNSI